MSAAFPFEPTGFFVLRTPMLPFERLEAWAAEPATDALRASLRAAVTQPDIREALFLASPDLEARLDPWLEGGLRSEQAARVERSLVRYLVRMASRCTPFGLFAGCSLGAWAEPDRLDLEDWPRVRRHTRLDMDYLCALAAALERAPCGGPPCGGPPCGGRPAGARPAPGGNGATGPTAACTWPPVSCATSKAARMGNGDGTITWWPWSGPPGWTRPCGGPRTAPPRTPWPRPSPGPAPLRRQRGRSSRS